MHRVESRQQPGSTGQPPAGAVCVIVGGHQLVTVLMERPDYA
jgi:phage gp45-like